MAKVILICGKICSGKTYFGRRMAEEENAVVLSCDEVSADIFHHGEGEKFDEIAADIKQYLHKIALRIARTGTSVLLDWGFWKKDERRAVSEYYKAAGIPHEWHYIDISDDEWHKNIELRNESVTKGESDDFFVDEGLLRKLEANFEVPDEREMNVHHCFVRNR